MPGRLPRQDNRSGSEVPAPTTGCPKGYIQIVDHCLLLPPPHRFDHVSLRQVFPYEPGGCVGVYSKIVGKRAGVVQLACVSAGAFFWYLTPVDRPAEATCIGSTGTVGQVAASIHLLATCRAARWSSTDCGTAALTEGVTIASLGLTKSVPRGIKYAGDIISDICSVWCP